jgi:hypothetical protein
VREASEAGGQLGLETVELRLVVRDAPGERRDPGGARVGLRPLVGEQVAVKSLLEGGDIDLWHFSTHGDAKSSIDESAVHLEDGELKAEDLNGPLGWLAYSFYAHPNARVLLPPGAPRPAA